MGDMISRKEAIDALIACKGKDPFNRYEKQNIGLDWGIEALKQLPSAQPEERTEERTETHACDCIERQAAIDAVENIDCSDGVGISALKCEAVDDGVTAIKALPSAQPEQRYTEEELRVFKHGISLSMLSKRSAQHWQYDEDMATKIKFLERLYEKVGADLRGEQDG